MGKAEAKRRRQELADAKKAVERAERARRESFRKALAALFNEYGMCLVADGDLSAHLKIEEMREGHKYPLEELPQ